EGDREYLKPRRRKTRSDKAASLNDRQTDPFSFGQHLRRLSAGVEPQFIAPFGRNFREQLQQHWRRQIDTDHLRANRDGSQIGVTGQALDHFFLWIYRVNSISFLVKSADGFIAEFAAVG